MPKAATLPQDRQKRRPVKLCGGGPGGGASASLPDQASFRIFEGEEMKKLPARRNPIAKALAKPQYRPRIKPDKRRKIEAKRMIEAFEIKGDKA
jgi:hypothetical protein